MFMTPCDLRAKQNDRRRRLEANIIFWGISNPIAAGFAQNGKQIEFRSMLETRRAERNGKN